MTVPFYGDFPAGATVRMPFASYAGATGASVTMTNFAVGDILVYKNGSTTERASTAGFTATTDFDAKTGLHMLAINTADNTDAGFFAAGNEYQVAVSAVTIDGQTVSFWAGTFSLERAGAGLALLKDPTVGLAALEALVDDLETRLSATRAGYLDKLNITGTVASQASVDTLDDFVDTEVAAILAAVDTEVGAIKTKTDQLAFTSGNVHSNTQVQSAALGLTTQQKADVRAEVAAFVDDATRTLPAQGDLPETTSYGYMWRVFYKFLRNPTRFNSNTNTVEVLNTDDVTVDHKATKSEAGGIITRTKFISGP